MSGIPDAFFKMSEDNHRSGYNRDNKGSFNRDNSSSRDNRSSGSSYREGNRNSDGDRNRSFNKGNSSTGGFNNRSSSPKKFTSNRSSEPRPSFKTICAECNVECDVPFKPTEGRPVYCRECFKKHKPQF